MFLFTWNEIKNGESFDSPFLFYKLNTMPSLLME